jgi:hypothetical protein
MKTFVLRFSSLVVTSLLAVLVTAAEPAKAVDNLTLEDVIFDASYLKKMLGPNTLVARDAKSGEIPTEAILHAKLDEKTKIYALPDEATKPELISSIPVSYPQSTRLRRDPPRADFLVFVGADGLVKCLYCYDTKDQVFAIVASSSLIKWRYSPAKIKGTAVPVLLPVEIKFSESDAAIGTFNGPKPPISLRGNPAPPPTVRPNLNQTPP